MFRWILKKTVERCLLCCVDGKTASVVQQKPRQGDRPGLKRRCVWGRRKNPSRQQGLVSSCVNDFRALLQWPAGLAAGLFVVNLVNTLCFSAYSFY